MARREDNSETPTTVGQAILRRREDKGLSREQLAEAAGCFASTIEQIEEAEIPPDRQQLVALADALEMDVSELFTIMLNKPAADPTTYTGTDVRRARKAMGLTQQQLAALAGCCGRTVSSFELGKNHPQRRVLTAIVKVLGEYLSEIAPGKVAEPKPKAKSKAKAKKRRKKPPPPAHIGEEIKRMRETKGISQ